MTDATKDPAAPPLAAYALWLVPSNSQQNQQIQDVINELSSLEHPSPIFVPHITLIHPIPLSTRLNDIHKTLKEAISATINNTAKSDAEVLKVELNKAEKGSKYYQCILAPINKNNDRLLELRKQVEEKFDIGNLPEYFPHLSLLYGNLREKRKDELVDIAQSKLDQLNGINSLEVNEVVIVSCVGTAEKWEIVGRERLN
ncbi:uncharacterized protein L201_002522 [Kwoniella dendrophila CBS 6074]|uniref:2',3'-cyclic-nucleotide 3'-phosphodiesterase n=1 Tax=Kwoniella dendrophila CBS 6074 TaxID=1295534 RepID=A0AAX4JQJ0_9TREE